MKSKSRLNLEYKEAELQIKKYTDLLLQAKADFVEHSFFKVGEVVEVIEKGSSFRKIPDKWVKVIVDRITVKYSDKAGLEHMYTLRKIKNDGTPSKMLYSSLFKSVESDLRKYWDVGNTTVKRKMKRTNE